MNTPKISLIISFYNKIQWLEKVLDTVAEQTFRDFEVVIADDGSCPEVVERIHSLQKQYLFPIQHVWHADEGWRKNTILNKAVVAANADYLVFIDGDCLLEEHFFEDHYSSRKPREVVTGRRVLLTEKTTAWMLQQRQPISRCTFRLFWRLLYETIFCRQKTQMEQMIRLPQWMRRLFIRERKRYILGSNFSLYKADLLAINGFDERFAYPGYGEDIDIEFRLSRMGIPAVSRKCQLVQYHCYHKHFNTDYAPNKQLLQDNTDKNITYTPYGILSGIANDTCCDNQ